MIRVPDGTLRILVQGLRRIRLERHVTDDPYLVGEFAELPDASSSRRRSSRRSRATCRACSARIIALVPYLPEELQLAAANVDDPSALSSLVASTLRLKAEEKQELLELVDVEQRLREVSRDPQPRARGVRARNEDPVTGAVGDGEGPARVLPAPADEGDPGRSSARAIPEQAEVEELRGRIEALELPEEVEKAARRELARLERMPSAAAEYGVIRTYLDWIATLPWGTTTDGQDRPERAREVLDADHFDLEKVKDRIIEHLAVSKLRGDAVGADPLLRRTARRRQDVARPVDRAHARAQVRAPVRRRRPRRGGDPRPPADVHRRDARHASSARSATPSR